MAARPTAQDYLWHLLEAGEYEAIYTTCPPEFEFISADNPNLKCPALIRVCFAGVMKKHGDLDKYITMLKWLIGRGT